MNLTAIEQQKANILAIRDQDQQMQEEYRLAKVMLFVRRKGGIKGKCIQKIHNERKKELKFCPSDAKKLINQNHGSIKSMLETDEAIAS